MIYLPNKFKNLYSFGWGIEGYFSRKRGTKLVSRLRDNQEIKFSCHLFYLSYVSKFWYTLIWNASKCICNSNTSHPCFTRLNLNMNESAGRIQDDGVDNCNCNLMFFWPCIMNWLYINYQSDALIIIYS